MTNGNANSIDCSVVRAEKLPKGLSSSGVCSRIREAAEPALRGAGLAPGALSVRVTVESETKLVALATLAGKSLPEHRVGITDHVLNARAVDMLANAIAAEIASTAE